MTFDNLLDELMRIRMSLDNMEDCEDGEEMIAIAQELSSDINTLEEKIHEEGVE